MKLAKLASAMLLALGSVALPAQAADTSPSRILRQPDIHQNNVTFVFSGDIYIADIKSGKSKRLTSLEGIETFPKFSPDGKKIAFASEHTGTRQIYVMNADGSDLKQLTFYNDVGPMPPRGGFDNRVLDWTPDGKHIVFRANRTPYGKRMGRPYMVPVEGGMETAMAIPETGGGMLSPDGRHYVYTPIDREFRTWKRYRGGRAQDVWTYDLKKNKSKRLTKHKATDHQPTWVEDDIFFVSDRNYTLNLFKYQESGEPKQVTFHKDYDVLWPSSGPEAVVYEQAGYLHRYDPSSNRTEQLNIFVDGVKQYTQPYYKNVAKFIESMDLSPDGKRVVFGARGELFSVPTENGPIRQLTHSKGREMSVAWSPDGKYFTYLSDETGEFELYLRETGSFAKPKQLTKNGSMWRFAPKWSANSKYLMFADKNHELWMLNVAKKKLTKIDASEMNSIEQYTWSPNSEDIVYVKENTNSYPSLWHYNIKSKKVSRLTDEMTQDAEPAFSPDGNFIYFVSKRDFNLAFSSHEFNYLYNKSDRIYAAAVNAEVTPLFQPKDDVVSVKSDVEKDAKESDDEKASNKVNPKGFAQRVQVLGAKDGEYEALAGVEDGVLALTDGKLILVSTTKQKGAVSTVAKGVQEYKVAHGGKKLLAKSGNNYAVIAPKAKQDISKNKLDLSDLSMRIDPKQEWQQIYVEAWRTMRDWFYDPNLHGMDWEGIREKYQPMIDAASHRGDIDYVLGEMAGEINAGHVYVHSGDMPKVKRKDNGLLGAEFEAHRSGYFKISHIFAGENWEGRFRSPLTEPGVKAKEGDYIIAINGVETKSVKNIYQLLEQTAGNQITLTLNSKPRMKGSWEQIITPIKSELGLRYLEWIQTNQAKVDKMSGGRIGYVHLPNTALEGNYALNKYFLPQVNKDALIIDDRYNGGGFIPDRMIEIMNRKTLNTWIFRGRKPNATPGIAHDGSKAMLINGYSSSGGDALPTYFRQNNMGTIIGTRTWGGLIGLSGGPFLADGGAIFTPTFRIMNNQNEWIVENEGVSPDIEVIDLPEEIAKGNDPSIEKAVEVLMKDIKPNLRKTLNPPAAPTKFIED